MRRFACNLCHQEGREFTMPDDFIGAALMKDHLRDEHGVRSFPDVTASAPSRDEGDTT